jgi:hypothetical protein
MLEKESVSVLALFYPHDLPRFAFTGHWPRLLSPLATTDPPPTDPPEIGFVFPLHSALIRHKPQYTND